MVQGPEGLKRIFLDNVDNYPKSEVMIRMLRPAVGYSLFTSEGAIGAGSGARSPRSSPRGNVRRWRR